MPTHESPASSPEVVMPAVVGDLAAQHPLVQWPQAASSQEVISLLNEWLADDSGYDEEVWPELKAGLERNRAEIGARSLFCD